MRLAWKRKTHVFMLFLTFARETEALINSTVRKLVGYELDKLGHRRIDNFCMNL